MAVTVPVASVPIVLKFVPQVSVSDVVPDVVIINETKSPAVPPLALNVQAPVGVMVMAEVVIETVIVPVVAGVAAIDDGNVFSCRSASCVAAILLAITYPDFFTRQRRGKHGDCISTYGVIVAASRFQ